MQTLRYPTDLTDPQWAVIEPLLPRSGSGTASGGRPAAVEKREIINALLDINRTGCQWRMLPKRWIVERTFAWLGRSRRLSKDYERLTRHAESFIYLRMTELMLRRLA